MRLEKPWNGMRAPEQLYAPKGMIGGEERRALYWIGKEWFTGAGAIIDAGAYVGASAFCLAAGVADNAKVRRKGRCIHSYDYFRAIDDYIVAQLSRDFHPVSAGGSYMDIFQRQVRPYQRLVHAVPGDFSTARWTGEPVEILFVDIAKTKALNSHLMREFFPHLIPGRSLVIQQDFYHCWHPYIHITMEALAPFFEIVDEHIQHQSRLYLCTKEIPSEEIAKAAEYAYARRDRLALLDALSRKEMGHMRAMIDVVKLWQLVLDEDADEAGKQYAAIEANYGDVREKGLWWTQAQEVMAYSRRFDSVLEAV
jgi:hypothetical protein